MSMLDAVRSGLANNPELAMQRAQIEIAAGAKEVQSGAFDTLLQSGITQGLTVTPALVPAAVAVLPDTETSEQTVFSISGSKLFRNGISVTPSYQLARLTDSFLYPDGYSDSVASLAVVIPLLRGRGRNVVEAQEQIASMQVRATRLDLDFLLSNIASTVAQDYWTLVAAYENLAISQAAETRGQSYVDNTQALIDADHVPRSDINEVKANLAQRVTARIAAQNSVTVSAQALAVAIGRSDEEILQEFGRPTDDFPDIPEGDGPSDSEASLRNGLKQALANRADYQAALIRKDAAGVAIPAAQNALRPALNATITAGYEGVRGGAGPGEFFSSIYRSVRGPNVSGGLTFSFPISNHVAQGVLAQAQGAVHQNDASVRDLARSISEGLTVAVANLRSAIIGLRASREEVALTNGALTGAREKYRSGFGSVVEILQIEDRLNTALTDQLQARLNYAVALTQYRFAVGALVPANQEIPVVNKGAFTDPIAN
jgi:outer membrane protein TolC